MSKHQFKPGAHVLVEGTFEMDSRTAPDCAWVQFPCACASPEPQETHCITLSAIHPTPREGEYRLTVDDLIDLLSDGFYIAQDMGIYFADMSEEDCRKVAVQWLEDRK